MPEEVLIFTNPKAGSGTNGDRIETLRHLLERAGFGATLIADPNQLEVFTDGQANLRAVVSAGGDGTAALVANRTPPGTPLAIMPLGTENLLAKYLKLTPDPHQIAALVADGKTREFDVGSVGGRLFLVMLSCGFDAEVVRRLHEGRHGNIHYLSYAKPILESIRSYRYPSLRVSCRVDENDEATSPRWIEMAANWVFVFNVPSYAAGLRIAPHASPSDGKLDVATFAGGSFWRGLCHLTAVVLGRHESLEEFRTLRTHQVRIESDERVPFQLDGDPGGFLPVELSLIPRRLTLVVPGEDGRP